MGKGKAPEADPRIGEAALLSAQTGQDYLQLMRDQAAITSGWAAEDRGRYQETFIPLEDKYIADVQNWASTERSAAEAAKAGATVRQQFSTGLETAQRQSAAMGVDPSSGRGIELTTRGNTAAALAEAGARNATRDALRQQEMNLKASVLNMGKGLEVNPGTSMGLANQAYGSGFQGAMSGYGQQGNLLDTQYQQQMASWKAQQAAGGSFWGGIGTLAGAFISDETKKKNRKKFDGAREAIDNMPVDEWDYKAQVADGGHHIGPMAQDFQRETGLGDGRSIKIQDAIGLTMKAVQEVSSEVEKLRGMISDKKMPKPTAAPVDGAPVMLREPEMAVGRSI
jgi:hypothetical protein